MKLFWLIFAMSTVLVTWVVVGIAFIGIGRLVTRRKRFNFNQAFINYWLGLSITLAFLQIWSLLAPINIWPALIVIGLGFLCNSRAVGFAEHVRGMSRHRTVLLGMLLFTFFLANHAIGPADLYDTRMYHINAMRWANAYPVIPGIANLQRNIAFNNANHLLAAMINVGPWTGRAQHVVAGLFLWPLGLRGIIGMARTLAKSRRAGLPCRSESNDSAKAFSSPARIDDLFFALTFPAVIALILRPEVCSLSSDLPAATLTFVSIGLMLRLLRHFDRATWLTLLAVLSAAVCCKLSTIGLVAFAFPIVALLPVVAKARGRWKTLTVACGLAILFAVSYMARGVIMSGYPLFPISIAAQNVEWRYPQEDLSKLQAWIRAHGRGEAEGMTSDHWFKDWAGQVISKEWDRSLPILLLSLTALILLAIPGHAQPNRRLYLAIVPAIGATLIWFITSPAIRFGFAFPWATACVLVSILWRPRFTDPATALLILCSLLPFVRAAQSKGPVVRQLITFPGSDHGFHPPPPAAYTTFASRFGVTMYVPVADDFIWNAPLPCTHLPNADLRQRSSDIRDGFVTDRK